MLSGVSEYELPQDPRWELPRDKYVKKLRQYNNNKRLNYSDLYMSVFGLQSAQDKFVYSLSKGNQHFLLKITLHVIQ